VERGSRSSDNRVEGNRKVEVGSLLPCELEYLRIAETLVEDTTELQRCSLKGHANTMSSRELKDKVFEDVEDFPISIEKAKELRLQLMAERSKYVKYQKDAFEETTFSLCEH